MPQQTVEVVNEIGLHASPLAQFVTAARAYSATTVRVRVGEREADGKGLISMLTLQALKGTIIEICTEGSEAEEALAELTSLVASGFERKGEKHE